MPKHSQKWGRSLPQTISLHTDHWQEIEQLARFWHTSRTGAVRRIYQEWRKDNMADISAARLPAFREPAEGVKDAA